MVHVHLELWEAGMRWERHPQGLHLDEGENELVDRLGQSQHRKSRSLFSTQAMRHI
jgi:hypothetical protein